VVITGISGGLGRALADEFARRGYLVFGCARSRCKPPLHNKSIRWTRLDVRFDQLVGSWAKKVIKQAGAPQILINNAGVVNELARLWDVPEDEFSRVIDTNLKGVANVIRHFVKPMCEAHAGIVVNISSRWGRPPEGSDLVLGTRKTTDSASMIGHYCASKWALEGLTWSLSEALAPYRVRAVSKSPGIVKTAMLQKAFPWRESESDSPRASARKLATEIINEVRKPIPDLSPQVGRDADQV